MEKIKFIEDNPDLGIAYDWSKIYKTCKRLGIYPKDPAIWNPLGVPVWETKWNVLMSIRSKGKTTALLLLGLVMYQMYGTVTMYLGQNKDKIRPKNTSTMYGVITINNYISKIFDGKYNDIILKSGGKWYLVLRDDDGKVIDTDSKACCVMAAIPDYEDYKSTFVYPTGDLIVFDEFISKNYYPNEFLDLTQMISNIIRNRLSPVIFMTANTINKHYPYFNELEIYDVVQSLQAGEHVITTGTKGTRVYTAIIDPTVNEKKKIFNRTFFGFANPALGAITGETTWSEFNYPHIIKDKDAETLLNCVYIYHNKKLVNLEIVLNNVGLSINVHWAKRTYDDSVIYTCEPIYDKRYRFKLGTSTNRLDKLINALIKTNKVYYATNDVGSFVESYLKYCKMI